MSPSMGLFIVNLTMIVTLRLLLGNVLLPKYLQLCRDPGSAELQSVDQVPSMPLLVPLYERVRSPCR